MRVPLLLITTLLALVPASAQASAATDRLQEAYGVGSIHSGNKDWSSAELRILNASLKVLTPQELRGIQGIQLVRMKRSPHPTGSGAYKVDREGPRILVYDRAFEGPGRGSSSAPNETLVHEFGHALSHKSVRVATRESEHKIAELNAVITKFNAATRDYNALVRRYNAENDPAVRDQLTVAKRRIDKLKTRCNTVNPCRDFSFRTTRDHTAGSDLCCLKHHTRALIPLHVRCK